LFIYSLKILNYFLVWNGVHFVSQGPYEGGVFRFLIFIPDTFPDGDCPVNDWNSFLFFL
jgi:ubiquitin-protein ligase